MAVTVHIAYFAGILDGEGSILLTPYVRNSQRNFYAEVLVTNTSEELMSWLEIVFEGRAYIPNLNLDIGHKPCWRWTLRGMKVIDLLEMVLPYLIIKRERAELVLEFYSGMMPYSRLSDSERSRREDVYRRLREAA